MIEPNPPIYFIRHGETDWNREGRIQGQIDIPLNDNGHQQAVAISRGLKTFLGNGKIDLFVASPLTRTRQTMGHLLREFDPQANGDLDVPDPYYGGPRGFEIVHDIVDRSCDALLERLRKAHALS